MSLRLEPKPLNAFSLRTGDNSGTGTKDAKDNLIGLTLLFSLVSIATLTIWITDPFADWIYECCIFTLAARAVLKAPNLSPSKRKERALATRLLVVRCALATIALWGFVQLAMDARFPGTTVDRWVTLNASLRIAALAATGLASYHLVSQRSRGHRIEEQFPVKIERFLMAVAWFGFVLAVVSWAAYYTSPQQILWLFPSRYPDVWGPFESRNHFAQFLELILPVCLWLGLKPPTDGNSRQSRSQVLYLTMSAILLGAGAASASRAGIVLLVIETIAVVSLIGRARSAGSYPSKSPLPLHQSRHQLWIWIMGAVLILGLILAAGGTTLIGRLTDRDPLAFRGEIFQSALNLIRIHPWRGYGIGTFALVYPEFARFDAGRWVEHAHNDWLEFAAGGGLEFALAWLVAAAAIVRPALRSIWGLGLLAVCVHGLVDDPFSRLGIAAWIFALAGVLERSELPAAKQGI
jgi:hypothetical protein